MFYKEGFFQWVEIFEKRVSKGLGCQVSAKMAPFDPTLGFQINIPGTFINFGIFFQGVRSYLGGYVY